jgi:hypothetical protein
MPYSFNLITQPTEADSLIKTAERDQRTLVARKQSLEVRTENSAEDIVETSTEIAEVNAELTSTNALLAVLPDGEKKEVEITKKMELELRLRKLNANGTRLNGVSVLEREYDIAQMDAQLQKITSFIAEVTAHKATL